LDPLREQYLHRFDDGQRWTLTLSGDNSGASGGVALTGGILNINSATALGSGAFTISGGTINNSGSGALTLTTVTPENWNADFVFTGTHDLNLGNGAVTLGGTTQVTVGSGNLTIDGVIGQSAPWLWSDQSRSRNAYLRQGQHLYRNYHR